MNSVSERSAANLLTGRAGVLGVLGKFAAGLPNPAGTLGLYSIPVLRFIGIKLRTEVFLFPGDARKFVGLGTEGTG